MDRFVAKIVRGPTPPETGATEPTPSGKGFSGSELARLYDFPPQLDGRGQTIAFIELGGGYSAADLQTYFAKLQLPVPEVKSVGVHGAKNSPSGDPSSSDAEVTMNIEVAGSVAPPAKLVVYFAPNTNSVLESATNRKITVITGSGDAGDSGHATADLFFPGSSPYVLACGGTRIEVSGGRITTETVWNGGKGEGGTEGGFSAVFPKPSWQSGGDLASRLGNRTGRGIPDVGAAADPTSGYVGAQTLPASKGFPSGPGWNPATGWGSPDGSKLISALRAASAP